MQSRPPNNHTPQRPWWTWKMKPHILDALGVENKEGMGLARHTKCYVPQNSRGWSKVPSKVSPHLQAHHCWNIISGNKKTVEQFVMKLAMMSELHTLPHCYKKQTWFIHKLPGSRFGQWTRWLRNIRHLVWLTMCGYKYVPFTALLTSLAFIQSNRPVATIQLLIRLRRDTEVLSVDTPNRDQLMHTHEYPRFYWWRLPSMFCAHILSCAQTKS